ncbi:OmpA family protein [candidate division KSB1 bacterium]|nr:OmpA family protein [candidate division KSB1 bacterium]
MRFALIVMIILFLILIGAAFVFYFDQFQPMRAELNRLVDDKAALSASNSELLQELAEIRQQKMETEKKAAEETQTYKDLVNDMQEEIQQGQIKISELAGKLKVNIVDKILFDSGEATVSARGEQILSRVGNILKQDTTKIIRVEGHSDNVKIHYRLQKKYSTNWELSTSRATNVVRFLQDELNIDGASLEAVGYAEFHPIASNKIAEGRSKNRRIEIVLVAKQ